MVMPSDKKYVLCPGMVRSRTDGDRHYIGMAALARLYGVRMEECEVYEPAPYWPPSFYRMEEERCKGLPRLCPREDGNYDLRRAIEEQKP